MVGHSKPPRLSVLTRRIYPQENLLRIVRTSKGTVQFDPEKNIPGRGLYVENSEASILALLHPKKKGLLEHLLKVSISKEKLENLQQEILNFLRNF